ncbi:PD-(D/E)XK nuclease family protein [Sulfuriferula sp.]|uniref:PD-(D/E)XK nuclease family protein n=1 Tax=Sulfuriferula sp. TaxID=2025307 RepID=UPI0027319953|nr:PD-(D/E)XK nuclease family protein [Sulfuriferula sp.]MDP2024699.1 PD-(D/E)XK nuclease family protein [Sulfuriferula sp.]
MPADLLERATAHILSQWRDALPDLSGVRVLVPNFHAVRRLEQVLARQCGLPVLLPPHITTFPAWAASVPLVTAQQANSQRSAQLYQILKTRNWFDPADLWGVCGELLQLFDELTLHAVDLPPSLAAFTEQLRAAYRARSSKGLAFEAQLIHELWFALTADAAHDAASQYALRLNQLATHADAPLMVVGLPQLSALERACLSRYADTQPVTFIQTDQDDAPRAQVLAAAWPALPDAPPLKARAERLRAALPDSPIRQQLGYFGAHSLEQEARAADTQIRLWLAEGKQRIAVIVQDRLTARRTRALLERAQILVADETGWTLATTAASTVVMRWLEATSGGFRHEDVLDLLQSPYLLTDLEPALRRQAAWQLESALRRHGPAAGLVALLRRVRGPADTETNAASSTLNRLQQAASVMPSQASLTLTEWLARLRNSLHALGAHDSLLKDAAGEQVLTLLRRREAELASDPGNFSLTELRRWLASEFETAAFVDVGVDSPVVFTHLAATRLRAFDAALIVGADADHLPGGDGASVFFNQQVRAELGLPTRSAALAQTEHDLAQLLLTTAEVRVLWQARQGGERNPISPWFERLHTLHQLAWGDSLDDRQLGNWLMQAEVPAPQPAAVPALTQQPGPTLPAAAIPSRISVSAYNSLIACPYQYFARQVLRLNPLDEISSALEKADYGQLVHAILHRFHQANPVISAVARDVLEAQLQQLTDAAFAPALADDYYAHAWLHKWHSQIGAYLDWQVAREAEGWRWQAGEIAAEQRFELNAGQAISLHGRLDRIDSLGHSRAVLDYKTGSAASLKDKARSPGEDVQLSAYALLLGDEVGQAAFVALDTAGKVETLALDAEPDAAADATRVRLTTIFNQLHTGAPLPAHGSDSSCQYCEMRGLCRKDYWPQT